MVEYKSKVLDKTEGSLRGLIENAVKNYWDRDAYTDHGTDINYTFGEVAKEIARLHDFYRANGIKPGDKVALCGKNSSTWSICMLSFLTYGCVGVPILADFLPDQVLNILDHSESKLFFCAQNWYDTLIDRVKIPTYSLSALPTDQTTHNDLTADAVKYEREDSEDLALLNYTSGSTGNSKGVMLAYRVLWSNTIFADERLNADACGKLVSLLPAAHMYGYAFEFLYEFCIGYHDFFLSKAPSPSYLLQVFAEVHPDLIISVPLIIEKLVAGIIVPKLSDPEIKPLLENPATREAVMKKFGDTLLGLLGGKVQMAVIGGASFRKDIEELLFAMKFPFTVGYGMTECGPIITYQDWRLFAPSSCGIPAPRMEVKIDSPDPKNIPGEIITRGINLMNGYYKNPEATAAAIDKDGWLHTGDLATMDEAGNVFIRGRKKNLLLGANGQNIYPEEIEEAIVSNSVFDEVVVVQRGEKLTALAYISDDSLQKAGLTHETLNEKLDEIRDHVNEFLPKYANITGFEVRDTEFAKTPKRNIKRYLYL